MAQCVACGVRRALALDCYCKSCLSRVHEALAELLARSQTADHVWRISDFWWSSYWEVVRLMRGGHDAA
jgi:hypothetical protein